MCVEVSVKHLPKNCGAHVKKQVLLVFAVMSLHILNENIKFQLPSFFK